MSLATPNTALDRLQSALGLRSQSEVIDLALCALDRLASDAVEAGSDGETARVHLEAARRALAHRIELAREGAGLDG